MIRDPYEDETSASFSTMFCLPFHCAALLIISPIPSLMCHRLRESMSPKPASSCVPARGRGRIRFLGSVVVTAHCLSTSSSPSPLLPASTHQTLRHPSIERFLVSPSRKNRMMSRSDHLLIQMILFLVSTVSSSCLFSFCDLIVYEFEIGMPAVHAMPRIHVYAIFIFHARINLFITLKCCYFQQAYLIILYLLCKLLDLGTQYCTTMTTGCVVQIMEAVHYVDVFPLLLSDHFS